MSMYPLLDITRDLVHIYSGDNHSPDEFMSLMVLYTSLLDDIVRTDSNHASQITLDLASQVISTLNLVVNDLSKPFGNRQLASIKSAHIGYLLNAIGGYFSTHVDPSLWHPAWIKLGYNPLEKNDNAILSA